MISRFFVSLFCAACFPITASAANSQNCAVIFSNYTSPDINGCKVQINSKGSVNYMNSCNNIKSQLRPMMNNLSSFLTSKPEIKLKITRGEQLIGTIDGIGKSRKATTKPEREMSKQLTLIDFYETETDGVFSGRYPAGTAGRSVKTIPLPFNSIKINTVNGVVEFNNELGAFKLKGQCK
jgi:hypothetical protein